MKRPVSKQALIVRLRRALRRQGKELRTARPPKRKLLGKYYVVSSDARGVLDTDVDIESLARSMNLLEPWERLSD